MRKIVGILLSGVVLATFTQGAASQPAGLPNGPVKLIVPFPAGGPTDTLGRIIAELLSQRWASKPVVVENRAGASTVIGSNAIARSQPDGSTLGLIVNTFMTSAAFGDKLPYDPDKDLSGIAMVALQPLALVANKSFPPNTVQELVQYGKSTSEPLNFTSPSPRTMGHLSGEMLKQRTGLNMTHINYTGSAPALVDVVAGRVPLMFDVWHSAKPHVTSGNLKLLASLGPSRLKDAPTVAAIAELYPEIQVMGMTAVVGPSGMPRPLLEKIAEDVRAVVASPEFADRTKSMGIETKSLSPTGLDDLIRNEIKRWREVLTKAKLIPAQAPEKR